MGQKIRQELCGHCMRLMPVGSAVCPSCGRKKFGAGNAVLLTVFIMAVILIVVVVVLSGGLGRALFP